MKQLFLIFAFFTMIASCKTYKAQRTNDVSNNSPAPIDLKTIFLDKKSFQTRTLTVSPNVLNSFVRSSRILSEAKLTEVNIAAVRHFTCFYKDVSEGKWFTTEAGYVVNFLSKGTYTKVFYDIKGRWLYNLLEYPEANLIFEIRDMVKRTYYDNDILAVHQFEFDKEKTVYLIRTRNQHSNIVTLKVCDGEIEDITNYEKN